MPGERFDYRFDYRIERQRHESFVGREDLLDRLDQLLVVEPADRWVLVTGGPGMGKSALLAWWLARRERAGDRIPHHFIRRGEYDWDDPAKLVGSLVAQLEEQFPDQREPEADARMHPAARLAAALARVSANELLPGGRRLVVLIDGLDEYDPPPGAPPGDPLAAFLPHALPRGVSFLCASRPRHPYVSRVEARSGELARIDLDDPEHAAANDATVRDFWQHAAPPLGLGALFINEAVARAGGNLQHATMLRKYLAALPMAQRRVKSIPGGLEALLDKLWDRISTEPLAVLGLGILCAAREALTLDELGAVAGWTEEAQRRDFLRGARELLVESWRAAGPREFRLHHESIREYIAAALGAAALGAHHAALAQRLAIWPAPADPAAGRYALRHALTHRAEAGDWAGAWRLAADAGFLEAKVRELGAGDAEADVARASERCRAGGQQFGQQVGQQGGQQVWQQGDALQRRFEDLARALARESHWLRVAPEATAALVWNRLRRSGWSAEELDEQLRAAAGAAFLRVRHGVTRESPALVRDLVGHTASVRACAVTADGRRAVSGAEDGTLKVWDLQSGHAISTLDSAGWVLGCAVTADGRRAVSGSADGTLKVWDLERGQAVATLEGHTGRVLTCAVAADGRRAVSGAEDGMLRIWDLERGGTVAALAGHASAVNACAVTADGRRAVSGSADGTLKVWDLEGAREVATLEGHASVVNACAVTADGRRAVSGAEDGTLRVWDLDGARAIATLEGHAGAVCACAVTADGRRAISASEDKTLKVWDLDGGGVLATLEGHVNVVLACAVTGDGRRVVSASRDGTLKIWDLESRSPAAAPGGHTRRVLACAVTGDGRRAVSASADRTLKVWDLDTGYVLATLEGHADWVSTCAVTADGRRAISASADGELRIWDLERGRAIATWRGHAGWVSACEVTGDGRRAASAASADGELKLWDLEDGRAIAAWSGHGGGVSAAAVTADGRRMVSASSADGTLKVWDLERGRAIATSEGHPDRVRACAVTADGRRAVTALDDGTLKLWDLETGRALATLEGHTDSVSACAVTADGRCVVSASEDRTLRVWDLETGACLLTHRGDAAYHAVAATSTGIIAGDASGAVWTLDWPRSAARPVIAAEAAARPAIAAAPSPGKRAEEAPVRRVLHLSDLHFSQAQQATVWYAQLAADLREQQVDRLDALVVTGDLVERADPAEYAAARRFLDQLMAGFSLSPRQVALVPGNHDASWPLAEQAYQLHRRKQYAGALVPGRYVEHTGGVVEVRDELAYRERLRPFAELYAAVKGAPYPLPFEAQGTVDDLADLGLCILGLDSAWETDHHFRDRASIQPEALASALLALGPPRPGQLRIAAFHHPIHGGEDSRIRDASFLSQLAVHGFRLALHGHVHKADAELYRHDHTEDGRRIELVAAGTFGAATREWVPGYPLQYNLLLVGPDRITVETRCRRDINGAWEPDARWRQGPGKDPLPRYFIER